MSGAAAPQMSVIIVAWDNYQHIRKTIKCLAKQTVREQLEIIIIFSGTENDVELGDLSPFNCYQILALNNLSNTAAGRARAIRQARAELVVFAEDHSFPLPNWAAALIDAHQNPYAGVGPKVTNANPQTLYSWADFLIFYHPWIESQPGGFIKDLPGRNSSYKRDILLQYGDELAELLESEFILHWRLRQDGYQLYLDNTAKTCHLNLASPRAILIEQFLVSRLCASLRFKHCHRSALQKLAYIAGVPLVPFLRLARMARSTIGTEYFFKYFLPALPISIICLIVAPTGELIGDLCGAGSAVEGITRLELHCKSFDRGVFSKNLGL